MTIRSIYRLILSKLNPLKYAQKSGVNMRGGYIYTEELYGVQNHGLLHLETMCTSLKG